MLDIILLVLFAIILVLFLAASLLLHKLGSILQDSRKLDLEEPSDD